MVEYGDDDYLLDCYLLQLLLVCVLCQVSSSWYLCGSYCIWPSSFWLPTLISFIAKIRSQDNSINIRNISYRNPNLYHGTWRLDAYVYLCFPDSTLEIFCLSRFWNSLRCAYWPFWKFFHEHELWYMQYCSKILHNYSTDGCRNWK